MMFASTMMKTCMLPNGVREGVSVYITEPEPGIVRHSSGIGRRWYQVFARNNVSNEQLFPQDGFIRNFHLSWPIHLTDTDHDTRT
jgi:hypothetical protein